QFGTYSGQDIDSENRIFLGLSSNFGAGFSNFSNVNQAREVRKSALAEADSVKREVSERVMSDFVLAQSLEHRVDSLSRSLETAKSVATSYSRQFLSGKKTWLDVMNSNRDLTQTEVQYAESLGSLLTVTWRLSIMSNGLSAGNDYRTIDSDDGFNGRDREDVKVMVSQVGGKDVIDPLSMDYQAVNYSLSRDREMVSKWGTKSDKYHVRENVSRQRAAKRNDNLDKDVTNIRKGNKRRNSTSFIDAGKNSTRKNKSVVQTSYVSLITTEK
ncbi:MAG: TolC family protein, partial [Sedimenticola sp.]